MLPPKAMAGPKTQCTCLNCSRQKHLKIQLYFISFLYAILFFEGDGDKKGRRRITINEKGAGGLGTKTIPAPHLPGLKNDEDKKEQYPTVITKTYIVENTLRSTLVWGEKRA